MRHEQQHARHEDPHEVVIEPELSQWPEALVSFSDESGARPPNDPERRHRLEEDERREYGCLSLRSLAERLHECRRERLAAP